MEKRIIYEGLGLRRKVHMMAMVFLLVFNNGVDGVRNSATTLKDWEVEKMMKLVNKPSVKSVQSVDGDVIDCIDIYKQRAFDHPLLKNHKIQMTPSFDLQEKKENVASSSVVLQVWQRSGSCPEGTIPVRRVRKSDLLRAASPEKYGMKPPHIIYHPNTTTTVQGCDPKNVAQGVLLTQGYSYKGSKADINVWNPNVENQDEFTTAQIWLTNGPYYDFDSMEAGWAVNPSVYGDKCTRLFAYWTKDASNTTGCFDHICAGFVQTSNRIALGAALEPVSCLLCTQYEITLSVARDPTTGNWWLQYGETENVGYWPSSLFNTLGYEATTLLWGGQVYSKRLATPHTRTQMGSGEYATPIPGLACYIGRIRDMENSQTWKIPDWFGTYQTQYNCYDILSEKEGLPERIFYFGGPGQNFKCP